MDSWRMSSALQIQCSTTCVNSTPTIESHLKDLKISCRVVPRATSLDRPNRLPSSHRAPPAVAAPHFLQRLQAPTLGCPAQALSIDHKPQPPATSSSNTSIDLPQKCLHLLHTINPSSALSSSPPKRHHAFDILPNSTPLPSRPHSGPPGILPTHNPTNLTFSSN